MYAALAACVQRANCLPAERRPESGHADRTKTPDLRVGVDMWLKHGLDLAVWHFDLDDWFRLFNRVDLLAFLLRPQTALGLLLEYLLTAAQRLGAYLVLSRGHHVLQQFFFRRSPLDISFFAWLDSVSLTAIDENANAKKEADRE